MTRALADVERDIEALDVLLRPYDGEIDAAPDELLAEFDQLHMERIHALAAESAEPETVAPRGAA